MDFEWTAEDKALRDAVIAHFDAAAGADLAALRAREPGEAKAAFGRLQRRLAETGYLAAEGMPLLAAQEAVAARSGSFFLGLEASARLFGGLVETHGGDALAGAILAPIQAGKAVGAVAVTDAPEGVAPTTGVPEGDTLVVTGVKPFVTNGPIADWFAVVCQISGAGGASGASGDAKPAVALVAAGAEGLTVGPRLATLGYDGMAVNALRLDGVRVPTTHVLGPFPDAGAFDALREREDLALTIASVGLLERTYEASRRHAKSHKRGGKPIIRFQEVGFPLAEMVVWIQTAQWMLRRAAWLRANGGAEAGTLLRCAKVFAADGAQACTAAGMSIVAGQGFLSGNPVEEAYRDAKYAAVAGTSTEKARMSIADDLIRRNPA